MKNGFRHFLICGIAALAATASPTLAAREQALRIEGIGPAVSAAFTARPMVRAGRLEMRLPDGGRLTIAPWPAYLPQRFGMQRIAASRQLHPAGPVDRISFTRVGESTSWLEIARAAHRSAGIVGDWKLQLGEKGWLATDGSSEHLLTSESPATVKIGRKRWCIFLLESRIPQDDPHVATEQEPQADWVAVRLLQGRTRYTAR